MNIQKNKGFTLVELLVTLIIITIAASVIFPISKISYVRDKEDDLKYYLKRLRIGIDDFKDRNPGDLPNGEVVAGGTVGDGIDNDGDGLIDEEIDDNLDNDGDGSVDEDLMSYGYPTSLQDMINNQAIRRVPAEPFGETWQYKNSSSGAWTDFDNYGTTFDAQGLDDIFDIRTSNAELSINGETYNNW